MAHFRERPNGVEVTIKRTGVLEKPLTFTAINMEEAQDRAARIEQQLDRGIVPPGAQKSRAIKNIEQLASEYMRNALPSRKDQHECGKTVSAHAIPTVLVVSDAANVVPRHRNHDFDEGLAARH